MNLTIRVWLNHEVEAAISATGDPARAYELLTAHAVGSADYFAPQIRIRHELRKRAQVSIRQDIELCTAIELEGGLKV